MINKNKQAKLTVDNKYSDEIIFELNAFLNTELWKRISIISLGLLDNNNPETIKEKILSKNELLRGNEDKFSVELQNENTTIPGTQIKEGSALIKSDKYLGRTVVKFLFR
ncbi:hypothetical protein ['Camptotheca acuminata' phytoplasma]|uniref:hypothetical protein n=1 Tax='Camptotheca acuminata' phytoplasma TaxID=3239192 RepID=UPI00351A28F6